MKIVSNSHWRISESDFNEKDERLMLKTKGGLHKKLLRMTLIPMLIMGVVITLFSYMAFTRTMQNEVVRGLRNTAMSALYAYDGMYPGDFGLVKDGENYIFCKGKNKLDGAYGYIDKIKDKTETDITFFFYDIRVLTTIKDDSGRRIIGTSAHAKVIDDVYKNKKEHFYHNVLVNDEHYYAYYAPIYNSDGKCIGMIFAGKPTKNVKREIMLAVSPILVIALIMIILTSFLCNGFTRELVGTISKEKIYLEELSKGNLKAELDYRIMQRDDEIGEMGKFTVHVQRFLKDMIERDALTQLFSRRIGELRLKNTQQELIDNQIPFCVVMSDIDSFKNFNDKYGHDCGDLVLKEIAGIFNKEMFGKGFAIRWGGEEFLLIYENKILTEALRELEILCNKIRELELLYQHKRLKITMTFGIVEGNEGDISSIIKEADNFLYKGKTNGRNQIVSK